MTSAAASYSNHSSSSDDEDALSSRNANYEALRLKNMQRNAMKLKTLGLTLKKHTPKPQKKVRNHNPSSTRRSRASKRLSHNNIENSYYLDTYEDIKTMEFDDNEHEYSSFHIALLDAKSPQNILSWIGKQLLPTGKRHFMKHMCAQDHKMPIFHNRRIYCNWKNAAWVYLPINTM